MIYDGKEGGTLNLHYNLDICTVAFGRRFGGAKHGTACDGDILLLRRIQTDQLKATILQHLEQTFFLLARMQPITRLVSLAKTGK